MFALLATLAVAQPEPQTSEEFYAVAQQAMNDKQMDKVVANCTRALVLDPEFAEAIVLRGNAHALLGQPEQAITDFSAALKMRPRSTIFIGRANQYMVLKEYRLAIADYDEAVRRLSNRSQDYELRARAKQALGDSQGAAQDRAKAEELASGLKPTPPATIVAAADGDAPKVYKIGGDVSAPKIVKHVEPEYSEAARRAKFNGVVSMTLVVDEKGMPRDIRVVRPTGMGLDEKALEAVRKWRFAPGRKNGVPVSTYATVDVSFRILDK